MVLPLSSENTTRCHENALKWVSVSSKTFCICRKVASATSTGVARVLQLGDLSNSSKGDNGGYKKINDRLVMLLLSSYQFKSVNIQRTIWKRRKKFSKSIIKRKEVFPSGQRGWWICTVYLPPSDWNMNSQCVVAFGEMWRVWRGVERRYNVALRLGKRLLEIDVTWGRNKKESWNGISVQILEIIDSWQKPSRECNNEPNCPSFCRILPGRECFSNQKWKECFFKSKVNWLPLSGRWPAGAYTFR